MAAAPQKALVKTIDMNEEMEQDVITFALAAVAEHTVEVQMAKAIKAEMDKKYSPTWHVVVGKEYGSHVVHATKHFIYFYVGPLAFLVFKSGTQWT